MGTPEHQRLLRAIAAHYAGNDRVLAAAVFGSLGRGTWDAHSDLDLDVVLADGVTLDACEEVADLCRALGERPAVVVPDRADAADDATRARFVPTVPGGTLASVQQAFLRLLDLLEQDLEEIGAGQACLTEAQRDVLTQLRLRQADLDLSAI